MAYHPFERRECQYKCGAVWLLLYIASERVYLIVPAELIGSGASSCLPCGVGGQGPYSLSLFRFVWYVERRVFALKRY